MALTFITLENFLNIYLNRKTLPPPLPLKRKKKKSMSPICGSKEKGILFSPFRPFSTDKNGIFTLA